TGHYLNDSVREVRLWLARGLRRSYSAAMNRYVPLLVATVFLSAPAAAQTVKCLDKAGKTTYTNGKCSDLGLQDAGEVPDHLNTNRAPRPPPAASSREPGADGGAEAPRSARRRAPASATAPTPADTPADPPSKERHCFTVRTPSGGSVTRCNDKPEGGEG